MNICVVIPVYNEARFIGPLIRSLKAKSHDIVVVDDGSSDQTSDIARQAGARVIHHQARSGKGTSLRDGFAFAVEDGYDGVIAMDGDGQHDPQDLGQFIAVAQKDPDSIIAGNRMDDTNGMPWIRVCTNRFMSWFISLVCRQPIRDSQCGYRYIGKAVLQKIDLKSRDFEIETEMLMKASRQGFRVHNVPIRTIYRNEHSKINPFVDSLRFVVFFVKEICSPKA